MSPELASAEAIARLVEIGVLPPGSRLEDAHVDHRLLTASLELPRPWVREGLSESSVEAVVAALLPVAAHFGASGVWAQARHPDTGEWTPLAALAPAIEPPPTKPGELNLGLGKSTPHLNAAWVGATSPAWGQGALSGKVVYVSQAHGFTWNTTLDRWATQRGNTHDIVEDLVNAEGINHFLVHYLRNAGATVFTVREHDTQPQMVIVDNDGPTSETETSGAWAQEVGGFDPSLSPYSGDVNPFGSGTSRLAQTVSGAPTATFTWFADIPADGNYNVYVSYTQAPGRASDAHFEVLHPGGSTHVRVDQRRHGKTWVFLGRFWFAAQGTGSQQARVMLHNDSAGGAGSTVSADAVRFGGGMGDTLRGDGTGIADSPTSNRPRWEECARYYTQFQGAPPSVFNYADSDHQDDVSARSRYAAWQNEVGEDAVYLSWHTNAPSPAVGTSSFIYGPNAPNGDFDFAGTEGSIELQSATHGEVISDIRAAFDPDWKDRGKFTAWFGEVNPKHNPEMPSVLFELAFHDTASDAAWLKQPRFRQVAARAMAQGIVKYFANRDGIPPLLAPEPPGDVRAIATSAHAIQLRWSPSPTDGAGLVGDKATGYRVYRSTNGKAWDDGTAVLGTEVELSAEPGVPAFFRVTGTNAGGESLPSSVVAAVTHCSGPRALIVLGFTRFDDKGLIWENLEPWSLGELLRFVPERLNSFDYVREHGEALLDNSAAFDSAEAGAVAVGAVDLTKYDWVVWSLGEESTADTTFSANEQAALRAYVEAGGRVFASGSEIAWDLGAKGSAADKAFLADVFGAGYAADDAGTYSVGGGAPSFANLGSFAFTDGDSDGYDVGFPDVLLPISPAEPLLEYQNGKVAAVGAEHTAGGASVLMGFPFEAVRPTAARAALMEAVIAQLDVVSPAEPWMGCAPESGEDAGGEEGSAGESTTEGEDAEPEEEGDASPGEDAEGAGQESDEAQEGTEDGDETAENADSGGEDESTDEQGAPTDDSADDESNEAAADEGQGNDGEQAESPDEPQDGGGTDEGLAEGEWTEAGGPPGGLPAAPGGTSSAAPSGNSGGCNEAGGGAGLAALIWLAVSALWSMGERRIGRRRERLARPT
jgi:hypothetical protein